MKTKIKLMAMFFVGLLSSQAAMVKNWEIEILPEAEPNDRTEVDQYLHIYEGKGGALWVLVYEAWYGNELDDDWLQVEHYSWVSSDGNVIWEIEYPFTQQDYPPFAFNPKYISDHEAIIDRIDISSNTWPPDEINSEVWEYNDHDKEVKVSPLPIPGKIINPNLKFTYYTPQMYDPEYYWGHQDQQPSLNLENIYMVQKNGRTLKLISLSFQPSQTSGELSISTTPTNDVTLKATGDPNTEYTMQSSEDTEVWTDLFPLQIPTGSREFLVNPEARKKFFRMRSGVQQ